MNFTKYRLSKLNGTQKEDYATYVDTLVRTRYSVSAEIAILRQRDTKPEEFAEYNEYVERCKEFVKNELDMNEGV